MKSSKPSFASIVFGDFDKLELLLYYFGSLNQSHLPLLMPPKISFVAHRYFHPEKYCKKKQYLRGRKEREKKKIEDDTRIGLPFRQLLKYSGACKKGRVTITQVV